MLKDILTDEILKDGRFWTHTLTLVENCTKISDGCAHCWSESMSLRFGGTRFNGKVVERNDRLHKILPTSRKRRPRVWTYWNDLFHEGVSEYFQNQFFNAIAQAPFDYHLICTKRPEIAVEYLANRCDKNRSEGLYGVAPNKAKNVIILVTMENQKMVDERGPLAAELSAMGWHVGILCEPLLSAIDLSAFMGCTSNITGDSAYKFSFFQWVICGPENGRGRRLFDPRWALNLKDQCRNAGVPFFFKGGLLGSHHYLEVPEI